jgi:hypothetical protein
MQIVAIRFADSEQSGVEIETTEQRVFASWPVRTWLREAIDAWLAAGNEVASFVPPSEPVPDASPLQLYDELDQTHGIDLEAEIGALSQKALRRFRISNTIRRTDQFAAGLQAKLGWTNEQVDALFRAAAART